MEIQEEAIENNGENFIRVDQLKNVIAQIKNNPEFRRIILSAWNPSDR